MSVVSTLGGGLYKVGWAVGTLSGSLLGYALYENHITETYIGMAGVVVGMVLVLLGKIIKD